MHLKSSWSSSPTTTWRWHRAVSHTTERTLRRHFATRHERSLTEPDIVHVYRPITEGDKAKVGVACKRRRCEDDREVLPVSRGCAHCRAISLYFPLLYKRGVHDYCTTGQCSTPGCTWTLKSSASNESQRRNAERDEFVGEGARSTHAENV